MRDDYAWDRTGERDPFVDEMEALLRAFDVQPRVAEGVAVAREVAGPPTRSVLRRHAFVLAATAALVLTLALIAARGRDATVMDRGFGTIEIPPSEPPVSIDPAPQDAAPPAPSPPPEHARAPALAQMPSFAPKAPSPRRTLPTPAPIAPKPPSDDEIERDIAAKIAQQLHRYRAAIQHCVDEGRKKKVHDHGYFWLVFSVTREGTTANVHTSASRPYAPDVEACVVAAARSWTFTGTSTIGPEGHEVRFTVRLYE